MPVQVDHHQLLIALTGVQDVHTAVEAQACVILKQEITWVRSVQRLRINIQIHTSILELDN